MQPKISSIASINIDEVYQVPHIVKPGETISSTGRQQNAGGKGANASVAAARAGAKVHVVGKIGHDGLWIRDLIADTGANVDQIIELDNMATGRAIIQVDSSGENSIVLFPGANHSFDAKDAHKAFAQCNEGDWLLLTNETTGSVGSIGLVRRLCNNTHEIPISSNVTSQKGAPDLADNLDSIVEIRMECAPVKKDQIKDTTAAGDTWVGYFAAELAQLQSESPESIETLATITPTMVEHAMRFATYASGISVSRFGAIPSIPLRAEVDAFIKTNILP
ncbi:hypothetical protein H4S08_001385 [Coemansia sp. RSA 1365]|nr:hypothetical protein H4S08_001385 [Coemansia sp. RSA 1365]